MFVAGKTRANTGRFTHRTPFSPWVPVVMLMPVVAVVAGLVLTTGRILEWYVAAVNVGTLLLYWQDKFAARRGIGRVPEAVLHGLALAGGTPAALLGQRIFRHKTRKRKFQAVYWPTVAIHLAIAAWAVAGMLTVRGWRGALWTSLGAGLLLAINVATFVIEPMRFRGRAWVAKAALIVFGGGFGAAFRDQRNDGVAWLPYIAATAQLGAALVLALMGVKSLIT